MGQEQEEALLEGAVMEERLLVEVERQQLGRLVESALADRQAQLLYQLVQPLVLEGQVAEVDQ